jgi:ESX secretion system ATPase EccB
MQSRRELLQAHRLMTQRAALALLQAEPDPPDQPLRRLNVGVISSVLVAVIVAAAFGVWGILAPGHARGLNSPGILMIDKETGTAYVWCQHGKLCPVVNYASARLALGTASPDQRLVTQASLAGYPRGPLIGIAGLPQPLPDAKLLVGQPWSVCVQNVSDPATLQRRFLTTLVGGRDVGGKPLSAGSALLVSSAGRDWVLWKGQRLRIPPGMRQNVLTALAATRRPAPVPPVWLDAFPQGPDFAPLRVAGFGQPVRGPGGGLARIGQVFTTSTAAGGSGQYYVLLRKGLLPVTPTQAALLDAARGQAPRAAVRPSAAAADRAPGTMSAGGLPQRPPALAGYDPAAPLCVVYAGHTAVQAGQLTVGGAVPAGGMQMAGTQALSRIALPPGAAALAAVVPGPSGTGTPAGAAPPLVTSYFLITGGRRYGLASPAVAAMLGYHLNVQRTFVPASVADLIPQGPALDPAMAKQRVAG